MAIKNQPAAKDEKTEAKTTTTDPWPGEGSVPRPPATDDKNQDAKDALFRFKLQMEQVVGEVDRILAGPYVGYLRQEAAKLKVPIGGDGRHWPPLNQILAVLEAVKKRAGGN